MKKTSLLSVFLAAVLLLSACSSENGGGQAPENGEEQNSPKVAEKADSSTTNNDSAEIEQQVVVDEAGIKITATGLENGFMGPEIKFLIENNSAEDLTVQTRDVSVNGYMVDTFMSADVAAGKKNNDGMSITTSSLDECGIENIADVEFSFHIFKTDGWDTYLDTEPLQLFTSNHEGYEYKYDDSGDVVYAGNGVNIVSKGLADDDILGPKLKLFINNQSGKYITVQARNVSINGYMVDFSMSADVPDGKMAVDGISFFSNSIDENGITDITDVEFSLVAFDKSMNNVFETDVISLKL